MKKSILFALLLAAITAQAQTFQLGVKGGVNISNFTGGNFNNVDKKALVGVHAGALLRFNFGTVLALQPEVLFSNQGAKLENAGNEFDAKVSYINVPVLLHFNTGTGIFLEAGPQVGFKVNEDVPDQTIEHFAKDLDLSIALGLGYQIKSFGVYGRYNIGVSKVGDFNSADIDPDFRNGVAQFGIYILFGKRPGK